MLKRIEVWWMADRKEPTIFFAEDIITDDGWCILKEKDEADVMIPLMNIEALIVEKATKESIMKELTHD